MLMDILEDINDPTLSIAQACVALGVSRATLYRRTTRMSRSTRFLPTRTPRARS
jgi:putative transposase